MSENLDKYVVGNVTDLSNSKYTLLNSKETEHFVFKMPMPVDMCSDYLVDGWRVDLFGDNKSIVFTTRVDKFWVRVWSRFFFGSRWSRINH